MGHLLLSRVSGVFAARSTLACLLSLLSFAASAQVCPSRVTDCGRLYARWVQRRNRAESRT